MLAAIASIATAVVGVVTNLAVGSETSVVAVLVLLLSIGVAAYLEASREHPDVDTLNANVDTPNAASEGEREVEKRIFSRRRLLLAAIIPIALTLGYLPIAAFNNIWPWNANSILNIALDPAYASQDILLASVGNNLDLHVSYEHNDAFIWGTIQRAENGEVLSIQRSFDGGKTHKSVGAIHITNRNDLKSTKMYPLGISTTTPGRGRACLEAADKTNPRCTPWLPICKTGDLCDGNPKLDAPDGGPDSSEENKAGTLKVELYLSPKSGAAYGVATDKEGGERSVWLNRRFAVHASLDNMGNIKDDNMNSLLGLHILKTWGYLINDPIRGKMEIRACTANDTEVTCTAWKAL